MRRLSLLERYVPEKKPPAKSSQDQSVPDCATTPHMLRLGSCFRGFSPSDIRVNRCGKISSDWQVVRGSVPKDGGLLSKSHVLSMRS